MKKKLESSLLVLEVIAKRGLRALIAATPLVLVLLSSANVVAEGNVVARIESGYLVLTGDEMANSVHISQRADRSYVISPRSGTTINGRGTSIIFPYGFGRISVKLNGGNDELFVADVLWDRFDTAFDLLLVDMGAGDDSVTFFGVSLENTFLSGLVHLGSGNDRFLCAACHIAGGFFIRGETGNDEVNLASVVFDNAPIAEGGGHDDTLSLDDCTYGRLWRPRSFEHVEER